MPDAAGPLPPPPPVPHSQAGVGPDRTQYEVWADPALERNTHTIAVDSSAVSMQMQIAGVPTAGIHTRLARAVCVRSCDWSCPVGP